MLKIKSMLGAILSMAYGLTGRMPEYSPTPRHRGATYGTRDRSPGKPGKPGDKLARMAAKGRIGISQIH